MLSFGSVAVTPAGRMVAEFEATLCCLDAATVDPEVEAWWQTQPEAYAAATSNPKPASTVMPQFVQWIRNLAGDAIFVAHPLALDGPWIDHYLQRFTPERLLDKPWRPERLFKAAPICLMSLAAGRLGRPIWECDVSRYPPEWLGQHEHTHRAIDDARGYANLVAHLVNSSS